MKRTGVLLVCLILAQQACATTMQSGAASLIRSFSELDLTSDYATQLAGLLEMRLEQGSKVDEVLDLINDLLNSLKQDQAKDDMSHSEQMAIFSSEIEKLSNNLERLSTELSNTNQFIQAVSGELDILKDTIKNLEVQLNILNGKEEEIRNARAADEIAYNRRVANAERVIKALTTINDKLSKAVFEEKDRQGVALLETKKQEVLEEIRQELGHNHPLAIFITMTAKFDIPTVSRILEKLENILEAVIASLNDDNAHEVEAIANFNTIIKEINEVRDKLSEDYNNSKQVFNRKSSEKVIAERNREQLEIDIPLTKQILEETKNQKELYHADYQARALQRGKEIEIVQSAFNLVNEHVSRIRNQEQVAARLDA